MVARKTVPCSLPCVRDQTEQIEKIGISLHILFLFLYFLFCYFFALFCVDMGHFLISFLYFFMFTNFGIPDIERRKRKRNLLIGQPQGSLSERIDTQCSIVLI